MEEKWTVEKLEGASNWGTWKFQMRHLLLAKGLWGHVDGAEVLSPDASDAAQSEFRQKSQRTFSTIVMAVGTSQLYLVTSCTKPKEAWDILCGHYEGKTLANKLYLKKRYFRTEMKEGTSMELHLKQMKEITDQLAAIGATISDEDQVVTLLGSLPPSYSALVTTLECNEGVKLSYVQQAVLHEERKQRETGPGPASVTQSNSALVGIQERPRRMIRCYGCGKLGHIHRFCRASKGGVGQTGVNQTQGHNAKTAEEDQTDTYGAFAASVGSLRNSRSMQWLVDSGASSHMTRQKDVLVNYIDFEHPEKVVLGDGKTVEAVGIGNVPLQMLFKDRNPMHAVLHGVLYVPKLTSNLFSVRAAATKGNTVKFGSSKCWIRDADGRLKGMGSLEGKLYRLDCQSPPSEYAAAASAEQCDADLWHQRFGHLNEQQLNEMSRHGIVTGAKLPQKMKIDFCQGCVEGKMHRLPFKPVGEIRSTRRLELVHSDVCGPMPTESIGGCKYLVTFIDDFSRCSSVYFMKHKSEVLQKFKEFEAATTGGGSLKIGTFRSDNGGEYISKEFKAYLESQLTP